MSSPHQALTLTANGKLRDIRTVVDVGLSVSLAKLFGIPESYERVMALWDTGANGTAISTRLANKLSLPVIKMTQVHGQGGLNASRVFKIDVRIPNPQVNIVDVEATEFVDNGVFDLLIGMDIITLGDFAITNANNQTVFSYRIPPADKHLDFVEEIKQEREVLTRKQEQEAQKLQNQARIKSFKKAHRHRH